MDIFEMLVAATNPVTTIMVVGIKSLVSIKGEKKAELLCSDNVPRVMYFRGTLSDALPNGTITITDISDEMRLA